MCLWYFRQYVGRHRLYKLCTAITRCFHKKRSPADVRLYRIVQRSEEMCREDMNINEVVYLVNSSFIAHTSHITMMRWIKHNLQESRKGSLILSLRSEERRVGK